VKTDGDRFYRFIENRLVKFEILKKIKSFEIKNSKKTRVHFKIFGENQIQKILD
jgi:hypothetical protein